MKHHIKIWDKYSMLTIISVDIIKKKNYNRIYCTCICECWNTKTIYKWSLINWDTTSCWCYQKKMSTKIEWMYWCIEYRAYHSMIQRCYNKQQKFYKNYWWRWIKVCDRWLWIDWFTNFYNDMWRKSNSKHSLDRINNNWDYCPENCRRTDYSTQNRNKSNSIKYKLKRITKDLFNTYYTFDTLVITSSIS